MFKERKSLIIVSIMVLFSALIVLGNVKLTKAIQRNNQGFSENVSQRVVHRQAMFHDKIFDIYVNEDQKFILVHGTVKDWKELDEVEIHFNAVTPTDYKVFCDVDLDYS